MAFRVVDGNGNEHIDAHEFEYMQDLIVEDYGMSQEDADANLEYFEESYPDGADWDDMHAEVEYLVYSGEVTIEDLDWAITEMENELLYYAAGIAFDGMDSDDSGFVDNYEGNAALDAMAVYMPNSLGADREAGEEAMEAMDVDENGVSFDEFIGVLTYAVEDNWNFRMALISDVVDIVDMYDGTEHAFGNWE